MTAASLVRLKITLDHVEPMVMQRVVVPWRIQLSRLHEVLQAAMGWTNSSLAVNDRISQRWRAAFTCPLGVGGKTVAYSCPCSSRAPKGAATTGLSKSSIIGGKRYILCSPGKPL